MTIGDGRETLSYELCRTASRETSSGTCRVVLPLTLDRVDIMVSRVLVAGRRQDEKSAAVGSPPPPPFLRSLR